MERTRTRYQADRIGVRQMNGSPCFLGIDSGSTTTKLVLIDERGRIAFDYYCNNDGNAIGAVRRGLEEIQRLFAGCSTPPRIARSVVTGYGEDLIRTAFDCDEGMVETLAHFRAARAFDPDVSFVLDIGGQDMKAIFVKDGHIQNIEINEACSSGLRLVHRVVCQVNGVYRVGFCSDKPARPMPPAIWARAALSL